MTTRLIVALCALLVIIAVVEAAPRSKSPWRRHKRESDTCNAAIKNCETCKNPGLQCLMCTGNMIVGKDGTYCVDCPLHADLMYCKEEPAKQCKVGRCQYGYYLEANECKPCPARCDRCIDDAKHEKCDDGWCSRETARNAIDGSCTACPNFCANCRYSGTTGNTTSSSSITCDNCRPGYYKYMGQCRSCGDGCTTCADDKGCTQCSDRSYSEPSTDIATPPTHVKCSSCPEGCTKCSKSGNTVSCSACVADTYMFDGASKECKACTRDVPQCAKCTMDGIKTKCTMCTSGFYLTASGTCSTCQGCTTCEVNGTATDGSTICKSCPYRYGISLIGNQLKKICDKCPDDCLTCSGMTYCINCKPGYAKNADSSQCIKCPSDCDTCTWSSSKAAVVCTPEGCNSNAVRDPDTMLCVRCPDNCVSCKINAMGGTTCLKCAYKYALVPSTATCSACGNNCDACFYNTTASAVHCQAHQCDPGYYLTSMSQCSPCGVPNCVFCNENLKCLQCDTDWTPSPSLDSCVYIPPTTTTAATPASTCSPTGCKACSQTSCTMCDSGIPFVAARTCYGLQGCASPSYSSRKLTCPADKCKSGYVLESGICHKCQGEHCVDCIFIDRTGERQCTQCAGGYALNSQSFLCEPCTPPCTSCNTPGTCNTGGCPNGYFLDRNACTRCGASCVTCTSATVCTKCSDGYSVNAGSCIKCAAASVLRNGQLVQDIFCSECASASTCSKCKRGYGLNSESNIEADYCKKAAVGVEYADYVNTNVKPKSCSPGYTRSGTDGSFTCLECPKGSAHCRATGPDTVQQLPYLCKTGYVYHKGSCKACSENCNYCDSPNTCNTHNAVRGKFQTSAGTYEDCSDNCVRCNASSCSVCQPGYRLLAVVGTCEACADGVLLCETAANGNEVIVKCLPTHVANAVVITSCTECGVEDCDECVLGDSNACRVCSFIHMAPDTDGVCKCNVSNCASCRDPDTPCEVCKNGYRLVNGACTEIVCKDETGKLKCAACRLSTENSYACVGCENGYYLKDGDCIACVAGCDYCDTAGSCKRCSANFILSDTDGSCTSGCTASDCFTCTSNANTCLRCNTGFYWDQSSCVDTDVTAVDGCVHYHTSTECHICAPGRTLFDNKCQVELSHPSCAVGYPDNYQIIQCKVCRDGFFLDVSSSCKACGDYCLKCLDADTCLACDVGYYLKDGVCTAEASNCLLTSNSGCIKCAEDYTVVSGACQKMDCSEELTDEFDAAFEPTPTQVLHTDDACPSSTTGCLLSVKIDEQVYCSKDSCNFNYLWEPASVSSVSGAELGKCTACPASCAVCYKRGDATVCKLDGCRKQYAAKSDGTCHACPPWCDECEYDHTLKMTVCLEAKCSDNYIDVVANTCIDCPIHGATCQKDSVSPIVLYSSCDDGYAMMSNGMCGKCPSNCNVCSFNAAGMPICSKCESRYAVSAAGICHGCPPACSKCIYSENLSYTVCDKDQCDNSYAQNVEDARKSCIVCTVPFCNYCLSTESDSCLEGGCMFRYVWSMVNGKGVCSECPDNCMKCESPSTCFEEGCESGYVLVQSDGSCKKCDTDNCITCQLNADATSTTCLFCESNTKVDYANTAISACRACPVGCSGCTAASATDPLECALCIEGYYKDPSKTGCQECGMNIMQCSWSMSKNAMVVDVCETGFGKNTAVDASSCEKCKPDCNVCALSSVCDPGRCNSASYQDSAGLCIPCSSNCYSCSAGGCNSNACDDGFRRTQDANNIYVCQACSDVHCLQCDADATVCQVCEAGYYVNMNGVCIACPKNCEICDSRGCLMCDSGWVASGSQCANCPFHCNNCTLDLTMQAMKCEPKGCRDGYGLDDSHLICVDCATLTGVNHCAICTDMNPATNKSVCLSCNSNKYVLSDDNATCHDCSTIQNCYACVDRNTTCDTCMFDLNTNMNATACGAPCFQCQGQKCPIEPNMEDVTAFKVKHSFCPDLCVEKFTYEPLTEEEKKKKHPKRTLKMKEYGCKSDFKLDSGFSDSCEEEDKCVYNDDVEYCCRKEITGASSHADVVQSRGVWLVFTLLVASWQQLNRIFSLA